MAILRKKIVHLLALLIPFFIFGDYLLSDSIFKEIAPLHFDYAEKKWFYENLIQGRFAWLYPYNELGHSLMTNPANGILYFPNLLHAVLPFNLASKILFIFNYIVLYTGLSKLLRFFVKDEIANWFSLLGISLGLVSSLPIHVAFGYTSFYPWAIAGVMGLCQEKYQIGITTFCLSALFLLGDPLLVPVSIIIGVFLAFDKLRIKQTFINLCKVTFLTSIICLPYLWMMFLEAPLNSRSLGIVSFEALSYSTAPIRILDWLFPGFSFYEVSEYLGRGFHLQWWFPRIGGGVVLSGLILYGLKKASLRNALLLGGFSVFFIHLALGQFSPVASYMFEHFPVFKMVRYPERFLIYAFPPLMILAAFSFPNKIKWLGFTLIFLSLSENLYSPLKIKLINPINTPTVLPDKHWVKNSLHQSRFLVCEQGLDGSQPYRYFDVRAYQLAMVNGTSNTRPPGFKALACDWALTPMAQHWLGYTHILSSGTYDDSVKSENRGLTLASTLPDGQLWMTNNSSPWLGYWVKEFRIAKFINHMPPSETDRENINDFVSGGIYFVDPGPLTETLIPKFKCPQETILLTPGLDQQSLTINIPPGCQGLLAIPWTYHFGWQADPPHEILRLNSSTIGVAVNPLSSRTLKLTFAPLFLSAMVVFSFFLQLTILIIIMKEIIMKKMFGSADA